MTRPSPHEITQLLLAWSKGDAGALEKLTPLVHEELQRFAAGYMAHERPGHTLQTTALVNEAYLRLIDWKNVQWQNRAHFFGVSARLMRHILVKYARDGHRLKRGGGAVRMTLEGAAILSPERGGDLVVLDEVLYELEAL